MAPSRSRSRAGPIAFLAGFHGYLQADAYAGYDEVFARGGVTEVGCWAHAGRDSMVARSAAAALKKR